MKIFPYIIMFILVSSNTIEKSNEVVLMDSKSDSLYIKNGEYLPEGFRIVSLAKGYLNEDTLADFAIITHKPNEMDSKRLIVLFKKSENSYVKTLETSDLITIRYDNEIEINNHSLQIKSDHPWHGSNYDFYRIKYLKDDWFCIDASSLSGDATNNWENNLNFETGMFEIKHTIFTDDEKSYIKEIKGKFEGIKPFSVTKDDFIKSLTINYKGKVYYIYDRNNLWSEDEIIKLNKK